MKIKELEDAIKFFNGRVNLAKAIKGLDDNTDKSICVLEAAQTMLELMKARENAIDIEMSFCPSLTKDYGFIIYPKGYAPANLIGTIVSGNDAKFFTTAANLTREDKDNE